MRDSFSLRPFPGQFFEEDMEIKNIIKDEADYAMYGYAVKDGYWRLLTTIEIGFGGSMPRALREYFPYYKHNPDREDSWNL